MRASLLKPIQFSFLLVVSLALAACAPDGDKPSAHPAIVHHSVFEKVVLSPREPEKDGVRLIGISDGTVRVRLTDGQVIAAPARKGEIFRHASHGYTGYTGIPLRSVNLRTGRVVLGFESRTYTTWGTADDTTKVAQPL